MASLVTIKGPNPGQRFALHGDSLLIGRQEDSGICLDSLAVSRQHARIFCQGGEYFVEDVGSSNGTYVNGHRITGPTSLTERDTLQIGPYILNLRADPPSLPSYQLPDQIISAQISPFDSVYTLYSQNPAHKLQVVLEISLHLGRTQEMEPLLGRLLEHLLRLFPQADRGMVLLCEGEHIMVRAHRSRDKGDQQDDYPYSRTIVRRALEEGVGLLSEDVGGDPNLALSATMISLNLRSFLCVPLLGWEGRRLGVIQLDCLRPSQAFRADDLEVLTALAIQVSTVLENMVLRAERLREERLRQELHLARDTQPQLREVHPKEADAIELLFFVGLTVAETAEALGVSTAQVSRWKEKGLDYLRTEIRRNLDEPGTKRAADSGDKQARTIPETHLTPELRKWLLGQLSEEEVAADLREVREKGGLELTEFVQELEQVLHDNERTQR
jgi:hypothetical protein